MRAVRGEREGEGGEGEGGERGACERVDVTTRTGSVVVSATTAATGRERNDGKKCAGAAANGNRARELKIRAMRPPGSGAVGTMGEGLGRAGRAGRGGRRRGGGRAEGNRERRDVSCLATAAGNERGEAEGRALVIVKKKKGLDHVKVCLIMRQLPWRRLGPWQRGPRPSPVPVAATVTRCHDAGGSEALGPGHATIGVGGRLGRDALAEREKGRVRWSMDLTRAPTGALVLGSGIFLC